MASVGFPNNWTATQVVPVSLGDAGAADAGAAGMAAICPRPAKPQTPNPATTAREGRKSIFDSGAELPVIGALSSDRQQRVLVGMLSVGVLGLVLASVLAVRSAGGSAGLLVRQRRPLTTK